MNNNLVKKSIIFFFIFNSGNFLSFIFQFLLARFLSVENFGVYNTLVSIGTIISFPTIIILFLVSSEITNKKKFFLKIKILENFIFTILTAVFFTLLFFIFYKKISNYLRIDNVYYLVLIFLTSLLSLFGSFFAGIAQGLSKYVQQSIIQTSPLLIRVVLLILFCYALSFDLYGALFANFISTAFPIVLGIFFFKYLFFYNKKVLKIAKIFYIKIPYKKILIYFLNSLLILLVLNLDIVIIKHFNSDFLTGLYSSSALLAKIIFFFSLFLTNINFRETMSIDSTKKKKITIHLLSYLFILLAFTFKFIFFKYFGNRIFDISFGGEFSQASLYFNRQLLHFAILSLITLTTYICISYNIYLNLIISIIIYSLFFLIINLRNNLSIDLFLQYLIYVDFIVLMINIFFLLHMYKEKLK